MSIDVRVCPICIDIRVYRVYPLFPREKVTKKHETCITCLLEQSSELIKLIEATAPKYKTEPEDGDR
jgi:hypothetical protein